MKKFIPPIIAVAFICLMFSRPGLASITRVSGTEFSNIVKTDQTRLHLKGAAMLTYLLFIEAYAGALYLPEEIDGSRALDDVAKQLVLEYRVSISSEDLAKATLEQIRSSVSSQTFTQLLPDIEALNRLYKSVKPGDRYSLTYTPGTGTQLIHNKTLLGTIKGAEFAKAMFGIWIGSNPIDTRFRDRLLGKRR